MTPYLLFQYIVAVGAGIAVTLFIIAVVKDWFS